MYMLLYSRAALNFHLNKEYFTKSNIQDRRFLLSIATVSLTLGFLLITDYNLL